MNLKYLNKSWMEHLDKNKLLLLIMDDTLIPCIIESIITSIVISNEDSEVVIRISVENKEMAFQKVSHNFWYIKSSNSDDLQEISIYNKSSQSKHFQQLMSSFNWKQYLKMPE